MYIRLIFKRIVFTALIFFSTILLYYYWDNIPPKLYPSPYPDILAYIEVIKASNDDPKYAYFYDNSSTSLPLSSRIKAKKLFTSKPLVIWATEWHMTPIKDLSNVLKDFGVKVIDYNLDPWRCEWHDCNAKKNLKVLTSDNVLDVAGDIPQRFYEAYKNDSEMASVDVVYCGYPVSVCELYESLNKSVLIIATTRYDVGRYTPERWNNMNKALIRFSKKKHNIIGGNSLYDAKYIQYFTGIGTQLIQSICDYTGTTYTNQIPTFLVLRRRDNGFNKIFFSQFNEACMAIKCKTKIQLVGGFSYEKLSSFRGVIHVPYQLSVMSIYEQYRMNIPMFFPTVELLADWQLNYFIMPERTFEGAWKNQRPNASIIPAHSSQKGVPDPKNEFSREALLYWIEFADFYQIMPHVFYYKSVASLVKLLEGMTDETLWMRSRLMEMHNIKIKIEMLTKWRKILIDYADNSVNKPAYVS